MHSSTTGHQRRPRSLLLPLLTGLALVLAAVVPPAPARAAEPPALNPVPQSVSWSGPAVDLTGSVEIIKVGTRAGDDVVNRATRLVTAVGGRVVPRGGAARIVVGSNDGEASRYRPASLSVPTQAEGYALATTSAGVPTVVALGSDADGAFHATTVLEQITVRGRVTGATIRDWPAMSRRGVVEGFYGIPWSHQARLDALAYMGRQRMNTYVYAPKDDPYLRKNWRELYPAAELGRMRELSRAAQAAHVDMVVTLSPGEDICYSSQEDFDAAVAVFEQLRSIGITSFYVALDDLLGSDGLPAELSCQSDSAQFTGGDRLTRLAQAQAHFLNRVQREYVKPNDLANLWTVPTQYVGLEATAYKRTFGAALDNSVRVQWTGRGIVTDAITTQQARAAKGHYDTSSLVIWDNFPTNDGENQARLFLGAMPSRSTDLGTAASGILTNPMIQPYASRLALADYAGYAWNPAGHSSQAARDAAIARIAGAGSGTTWEALHAFVDVHQQWEYSGWRSTDTWKDIYDFIEAARQQDQADLDAKASALRARLVLLRDAPTTLASVADKGFYTDTRPWIEVTSQWARADLAALDLILALRRGDTAAAQRAQTTMEAMVAATSRARVSSLDEQGNVVANAVVPKVGENAMSELVEEARTAWRNR